MIGGPHYFSKCIIAWKTYLYRHKHENSTSKYQFTQYDKILFYMSSKKDNVSLHFLSFFFVLWNNFVKQFITILWSTSFDTILACPEIFPLLLHFVLHIALDPVYFKILTAQLQLSNYHPQPIAFTKQRGRKNGKQSISNGSKK